jgi:hypothetical protein
MENILTKRLISLMEDFGGLDDQQKNSAKNLIWLLDDVWRKNLYALFLKEPELIKKFVIFGVAEKTAMHEKDMKKLEGIFQEELKDLGKVEAE